MFSKSLPLPEPPSAYHTHIHSHSHPPTHIPYYRTWHSTLQLSRKRGYGTCSMVELMTAPSQSPFNLEAFRFLNNTSNPEHHRGVFHSKKDFKSSSLIEARYFLRLPLIVMVKILMVHGFGVNAAIFEAQTGMSYPEPSSSDRPLRTTSQPYSSGRDRTQSMHNVI